MVNLQGTENFSITNNRELSELPDTNNKNSFIYYQRKSNGVFSIWKIKPNGKKNKKIIGK